MVVKYKNLSLKQHDLFIFIFVVDIPQNFCLNKMFDPFFGLVKIFA